MTKSKNRVKTKKAILTVAVVVVAAALLLAATFAWFTTEQTVLNKFSTATDPNANPTGVEIVEDFDEDEAQKFDPGVDVKKDVKLVATGTGTSIARVRFEEVLRMFAPDGTNPVLAIETFPTMIDLTLPANADYFPSFTSQSAIEALATANSMAPVTMTALTEAAWASKLEASASLRVYGKQQIVTSKTTQSVTNTYLIAVVDADGAWRTVTFTIQASPTGGTVEDKGKTEYPIASTPATLAEYLEDAATNTGTDYPQATLEFDYFSKYSWGANGYAQNVYLYNVENTAFVDNLNEIIHKDPALGVNDIIALQFLITTNNIRPLATFDQATPVTGDFWYYDTDGWFYWANTLENADTTTSLLQQVSLSGAGAKANYMGMDYDLNVRMEALQAIPQAVQDTWNIAAYTREVTIETDLDVTFSIPTMSAKAKELTRILTGDDIAAPVIV